MNHWLLKTEPDTYSWNDLIREKTGTWDGIRNFQARNNLQAMKKGDLVFIYHTGNERAITGIAKVTTPAFPEPGASDWFAVKITAVRGLKHPVTLADIKTDPSLTDMSLIRLGRLSVHPVTQAEFDRIVERSEKP